MDKKNAKYRSYDPIQDPDTASSCGMPPASNTTTGHVGGIGANEAMVEQNQLHIQGDGPYNSDQRENPRLDCQLAVRVQVLPVALGQTRAQSVVF